MWKVCIGIPVGQKICWNTIFLHKITHLIHTCFRAYLHLNNIINLLAVLINITHYWNVNSIFYKNYFKNTKHTYYIINKRKETFFKLSTCVMNKRHRRTSFIYSSVKYKCLAFILYRTKHMFHLHLIASIAVASDASASASECGSFSISNNGRSLDASTLASG